MRRTWFSVAALALACAASSREREGQRSARTQTETIRGVVAAVSLKSMSVRSDDDGEVQLQVTDATIVTLDGRKAAMSAIHAGSDVSAAYGVLDRRMLALSLEVSSIHPGEMPRTPEPSSPEAATAVSTR